MKLASTLLTSRFLTRFGDQAWDFALPVTLAQILPLRLRLVVLLFLATKVASVIALPRLASLIDSWPRMRTVTAGIGGQFFGVLVASSGVLSISGGMEGVLSFSAVVIGAVVASLGASIMEIAIGADWIPSAIPPVELARVNARLRQADLTAEVGAPFIAGLLLAFASVRSPLIGFFIVSVWNVTSFLPEWFLLRHALTLVPELRDPVFVEPLEKIGPFAKLTEGWIVFRRQTVARPMIAHALLWLSALSPHGVLLTTYLKADWKMSPVTLSAFRAAGAIFGLISTLLFPYFRKKLGLERATGYFLYFQSVMVIIALVSFLNRSVDGLAFLAFVLLSRVGLYGFSLGEWELRQSKVAVGERGKVNGAASGLTSLATLLLFAMGAVFADRSSFRFIVWLSTVFVFVSALVYFGWEKQSSSAAKAERL